MKRIGMRTRLMLFYTAALAILLSGFGALYYHILAIRLDGDLTEELRERSAALRGYLKFGQGGPEIVFDHDDPNEAFFIRVATRYYQLYDARSGNLITQSPEMELLGLTYGPTEVKSLINGPPFDDVETDQGSLRFHNTVVSAGPNAAYLLQVGTPLKPVEDALRGLIKTLLWLIPSGVLLAAVAGWWIAGRALQPIVALADASRKIGVADLKIRLPVAGSDDELDGLAESFNETLDRLEKAVEEMRQFTGSIAHELRTPLAVLRGEAEVALTQDRPDEYRRVLMSQLEEFEKLARMISHLLTLARAEGGEIELKRHPVDLAALTRSIAEQMELVASAKGVSLKTEIQDAVTVLGDSDWLERIVLNLLDNAIKFTGDGGTVSVAVAGEDGKARLAVDDTGCGISADALPNIFRRFFRADPARSSQTEGAGLGLSLVKWAVEKQGGDIQVESQPDRGSRFTIRLPLAERDRVP